MKEWKGKEKMTIEEFIERCQKRPLPSNPMARVKVLARELAEGASYELWAATVHSDLIGTQRNVDASIYEFQKNISRRVHTFVDAESHKNLEKLLYSLSLLNDNLAPILGYIIARWGTAFPNFSLLLQNNYITIKNSRFIILEKAFALLEEADPATIFISYKRSESSAFALLIEQSLVQAGLSPFLDKQLQAGDDWHAELEKRIEDSDYLIILLGQETLESEVTLREIGWAIQYKTGIIPIWHNNFSFTTNDWPDLDSGIIEAISSKHAIRVLEENPLLYDTALRELLNRFGITL